MMSDAELLRQYVEGRSDPAFGELVARHIDLVYSVAVRVVNGDTHLAQDVTQTVFIDLARKARRLPEDVVLAGWLHRHTCYTAATAVRSERRRKTREQTAMEMKATEDNGESPWEMIAPYLDDALNQLNPPDRDALVLRFLKRQDLRTVGAALGVSEDSAQKRVSRALEKLRALLGRRGVTLTAAMLGSALVTHQTAAAPIGFALAVKTASLTAAAKTGTTLTLLELMTASKLNTGILAIILLASATAPLVMQHEARATLRGRDSALLNRANEIAAVRSDNERLGALLGETEIQQRPPNHNLGELLRLRGEVARLQADVRELSESKTNEPLSREEALASMRQMYSDRIDRLKQQFAASPAESVPELQYLTGKDWLELVTYDHHRIDPDNRKVMSSARTQGQMVFARDSLSDALEKYGTDNNGQFPTSLSQLVPYLKSPVDIVALQGWAIVPTSSLPESMRINEEWTITQKAPINAERDQRIAVGLKAMRIGNGGTNDWLRFP